MIRKIFGTVSLLVAASVFPLMASAEEDLCGKLLPPALALGEYTMVAGEGSFTARGMTIPMHGDTGPASFSLEDGTLVLTSTHSFHVEFQAQLSEFEDWWGVEDDFINEVELEDVDISLCPTIESLPRLLAEGQGRYIDNDGVQPHVKISLLVYDVSEAGVHASGIMKGTGKTGGISFTFKSPIDLTPR